MTWPCSGGGGGGGSRDGTGAGTRCTIRARVPPMEKLQYLCWPRAGTSPADHGRVARDDLAPALLALGPRGLSFQVDDADAQVPVPMPPPTDEPQPYLLASIWLDRYDDRAAYEALLRDAS